MNQNGDVNGAVAQFYQALNALFLGDVEPMGAIWSHRDDVTYLGPNGGMLVGWPQIEHCWREQAALKLGGQVDPRSVHIVEEGSLALVQNFEIGTNFVYDQAKSVDIRATHVFRKEEGTWKMITHQTDLIPWLESNIET